jgi:hypothetical protein
MENGYLAKEKKDFDVFLSYSHLDVSYVEELAKRLEDEFGFHVWLDKWILIPGENWQQAISQGLDQAKSCAVCIGEHTPNGWFREEIERAINRQTKNETFRVIPVLLPKAQKINVDNFLELRTWVDLRNGMDDDWNFHLLTSGIRGIVPGRPPQKEQINEASHIRVKEKLINIRKLRSERLIDDIIALEYQRRLLDIFIKVEDLND